MTTLDVARRMNRSVELVRKRDKELRPTRTPSGHRRYDPQVVEEYLAKKADAEIAEPVTLPAIEKAAK